MNLKNKAWKLLSIALVLGLQACGGSSSSSNESGSGGNSGSGNSGDGNSGGGTICGLVDCNPIGGGDGGNSSGGGDGGDGGNPGGTTDIIDPLFVNQWHLNNTGQDSAVAGVDINVMSVWNSGDLGSGVTVTVTDDGVMIAHEDLKDNVLAGKSKNYIADNGKPSDDPTVFDSHGTAVAGLILASANNLGGRGVAPKANLVGNNLLSRTTSSGQEDIDAMLFSASYSRINNNSWGTVGGNELYAPMGFWDIALTSGVSTYNVSYVFAAGNSGRVYKGVTEGYKDVGERTSYNAFIANSNVIVVGAVDSHGYATDYSTQGVNILVAAPSNSFANWTPALYTTASSNTDIDIAPWNTPFYTNGMDGTSGATPQVSGVIALMLSAKPTLTWRDVRWILAATAKPLSAAKDSGERGSAAIGGKVYSSKTGFGLVDAAAAVTMAKSFSSLPDQITCNISSNITTATSIEPGTSLNVTFTVPNDCGIKTLESIDVSDISILAADSTLAQVETFGMVLKNPLNLTSVITTAHQCYDARLYNTVEIYNIEPCSFGYDSWQFSNIRNLGEKVSQGDTWTFTITNSLLGATGSSVQPMSMTLKGY